MSSKVIGIPAYDTQYIYIYIYTVTFKDGLIAEYIKLGWIQENFSI